jgi:hypothetical protein
MTGAAMNSEGPELPRSIADLWPLVWPLMGGLGGAIISLGLARNATLTARKKAFNVLSGTIAAVFIGPLVVRWFLGPTRADSQMVGAIYCLVGLTACSVIELVVRKIGDWIEQIPSPKGELGE